MRTKYRTRPSKRAVVALGLWLMDLEARKQHAALTYALVTVLKGKRA